MGKFVKYLGVLGIFFTLVIFIEWSNKLMKSLVMKTFEYGEFVILVQVVGSFLFGLFLGSLNFIREFKKGGSWKVNKEKLLVLGLPLLLILVLLNSVYIGPIMPQIVQRLHFYILTMNLYRYIAIFLGYILISSFTKEVR